MNLSTIYTSQSISHCYGHTQLNDEITQGSKSREDKRLTIINYDVFLFGYITQGEKSFVFIVEGRNFTFGFSRTRFPLLIKSIY